MLLVIPLAPPSSSGAAAAESEADACALTLVPQLLLLLRTELLLAVIARLVECVNVVAGFDESDASVIVAALASPVGLAVADETRASRRGDA